MCHPLPRFLCTVENRYRPNPYHNRTHAADVLHSMHVLLTHGGLSTHYANSPGTRLACYLAAVSLGSLGGLGSVRKPLAGRQSAHILMHVILMPSPPMPDIIPGRQWRLLTLLPAALMHCPPTVPTAGGRHFRCIDAARPCAHPRPPPTAHRHLLPTAAHGTFPAGGARL